MNVVLPDLGQHLAESLYEDVMGLACDLRLYLRDGFPQGKASTDLCLSYVRVTGTLTARVISMVCWACAYRALQGRDIDKEPFRDLVSYLGQAQPAGAGRPGEDDFAMMRGLDALRVRFDAIEARIHHLDPDGLSSGS